MPSSTFKRRRLSPPPAQPQYSLDDEEDDSAPTYVPVKKRREALLTKLSSRHGAPAAAVKEETQEEREEREREEAEGVRRSKTAKTLLMEAQEVKRLKALAGVYLFPLPLRAGLRTARSLAGWWRAHFASDSFRFLRLPFSSGADLACSHRGSEDRSRSQEGGGGQDLGCSIGRSEGARWSRGARQGNRLH